MLIRQRYYFARLTSFKKLFGVFSAISYLGSFLALAGGLSLFSFLQCLLNFMRLVIPSMDTDIEIREIPALETKTKLRTLLEKLSHLKEHVEEFVKMSSIHGVHSLTGGFRGKFFWLAVISIATFGCAYFVKKSLELFSQNEVITEYEDKSWSVQEVCFYQSNRQW